MAGVTKEEIARAKELDLLTYFKLVEPGNLKLVGKEYRHKVHSSLTISKDSLWCWHCIGLRGRTALKYLIDVEKVPYVEAVREINRIQGGVVHSSQPVSLPQPRAEPEAPRDFKLPEPDTNSYAAMAYLRGRCIHPNVLAFCRRESLLYRVLMVDFDPQGNLSCYCGIPPEKDLDQTITELLMKTSCEKPIGNRECVYQTGRKEAAARVDFIPSNLRLAGFELAMGTMMCREVLLKSCLEQYNNQYDYCLIDCSPSVGLLLTNALAAANEIIIPMQAQPFSVVGMSQLTSSIANVQRKINPGLRVKGILLTMTEHTNVSDHYCGQVRSTYGNKIHVFTTEIPRNVKVQESQANAEPTILYDPKSNSAKAYIEFAKEVSGYGREKQVFERDENALNR